MAFIRTFKQKGGKVYRALMRSKWNPLTKRSEQHVVKWLGRTGESEAENFDLSMSCRSTEEKFLFDALSDRRSLLVHGQWGVGKSFLAQRVYRLLTEAGHSAHYFRWTTPQGEFIKQICEALDLPTTRTSEDGEKEVRIPQAQLLNDIGGALIEDRHILIIDKAHSIPVQIRNNIEVWLEGGATIMLVGTLPPKKEL